MYISKCSLKEDLLKLRNEEINLIDYINEKMDLIEKNEPIIESMLPEENRRDRVLNDAKVLLEKYPNKENRPELFGLLIGVKDLFFADGFDTKCGSKLPKELFVGKEATVVSKLKEKGAIVLGKTHTTEFAYFNPAPTKNPHNIEHTPGGSSSGSAAAVAAGFCPFAFGTQTIGSVTRPASFCGIYGLKPSFNRIETDGIVPFSLSVDHVGYFAQSLESIEFIAPNLVNAWNDIDFFESDDLDLEIGQKPVIGIVKDSYFNQTEKDAIEIYEKDIEKLKESGFEIKVIEAFDNIEEINELHRNLNAYEFAEVHKVWFKDYRELYSEKSRELIEKGQKISISEVIKARANQVKTRWRIQKLMKDYGLDLIVCPSTTGEAPHTLESTGSPIMNLPWTYTGLPTVTIPGTKSKNNMPLGLQIVGKYMQDEILIKHAKLFDKVFN